VTQTVQLGLIQFENSGVLVGPDSTVPVFPMEPVKCVDRSEKQAVFARQCCRQWFRTIDSHLFRKVANDDVLLYTFLARSLLIHLMDGVTPEILSAYKYCSMVGLRRCRYQSGGIMEIEHLERGNPPQPVCDAKLDGMNIILREAGRLIGLELRPYTLWYGIVLMLDIPLLIVNQLPFARQDIELDFPESEPSQLLKNLRHGLKLKPCRIIDISDHDYFCYVSLDDTSSSGGWILPSHNLTPTINCAPKYVISQDSYEYLFHNSESTSCPVCYKSLQKDGWIQIGPKHSKVTVDCKLFRPECIPHSIDQSGNDLVSAQSIDFESFPLSIRVPSDWYLVTTPMNKYRLIIRSEDEFKKSMWERVPFLKSLDMSNITIADRFVRSILFNQPINDIDFFFVGLDVLTARERLILPSSRKRHTL